jgi:hypothetical protein
MNRDKLLFLKGQLAENQLQLFDQENPDWLALDAYSAHEKEHLCLLDACGLLQQDMKERVMSRAPQFPWKSRIEYERKMAEWRENIGVANAQPGVFLEVDGYAVGLFNVMMLAVHRVVERMEHEDNTDSAETEGSMCHVIL